MLHTFLDDSAPKRSRSSCRHLSAEQASVISAFSCRGAAPPLVASETREQHELFAGKIAGATTPAHGRPFREIRK
jgi:hypothetical protein